MKSVLKQTLPILMVTLLLSSFAFSAQAQPFHYKSTHKSQHFHKKHKQGICEEYVRGLYASQRYDFEKMHKKHVKEMQPLYREYERLQARNANERRIKDLEREITRLDRNFAKKVSKRFGVTLFDGNKIIQHGNGLDSPCGYSGYGSF